MDLNRHALEGIQLAGDPITLPDNIFQELIKAVFEVILSRETDVEELLGSLDGSDLPTLKQCFYSLSTLLVEIAKANVEESSISSLLEECKWTSDRVEEFSNLIKINIQELRMILGRLDYAHPHIVDVDWRLDSCIKTNHLEKINKFNYLISLKTQEPGKDGCLEFSCSMEQLQDLVSKLQDATKSIEKASEA